MVLRRDAPIEVDFDRARRVSPTRPRSSGCSTSSSSAACDARLDEALGGDRLVADRAVASAAEVMEAEITEAPSAAAAAALIAGAGDARRRRRVGRRARAAATSTGWPSCSTRDRRGRCGSRRRLAHDDAVLAAVAAHPALRSHNAKALMRWLLGRGHRRRRAAARHADRRLPHRPGRGPLRAGRPARAVHAVPAAARRPAGRRASSTSAATATTTRVATARQALAVSHLSSALESSLDKQGMVDLYRTIENPLVGVLAKMEHVGIAVDIAELRRLNDRLTSEVERLGAELRARRRPRRSTSTRRCSCARSCYTERQLAPSKKTKTGFSTDAATLEKLRDQWPEFIDPLLQYREVEKLRGTYGDGLLAEVAPDGRIHATFNQTVARTGRLSQRPAEPAQHPGAPRGGPAVPQGVHPRARAACCSSPTTTRSSCAASPTWPPTRA